MECLNCGETDTELFFRGICRRCIGFSIVEGENLEIPAEPISFSFELTSAQKSISERLSEVVVDGDVFIDAVCGAGKTEICLETVKKALYSGKRIGWAIPRREVVLELSKRLQDYFSNFKVTPVCQGYTKVLDGNIIVCTTHQLFRYPNYFDILILDEPDAFPFAGDVFLQRIMKKSTKGSIVYLSATFEIDNVTKLSLPIRPSYKLLPVPKIVKTRFMHINLLALIMKYREEHCLIFVPTIDSASKLSRILRIPFLTSLTTNKEEIITNFKLKRNMLITTTVLERGVTFIDCFVFVMNAEHRVYDEGSLIQIAGRAMRGMNPQKGGVWFLCSERSLAIEKCMKRILKANEDAASVIQKRNKEWDF